MRKFLIGISALWLGISVFGNSLPISAAEPVSPSFIKKMSSYTGRVLNAKEAGTVLRGNTIYQEREGSSGSFFETSNKHAKKGNEVVLENSLSHIDDHYTTWQVKEDGTYCFEGRSGERCLSKVMLKIVDNEVIIFPDLIGKWTERWKPDKIILIEGSN